MRRRFIRRRRRLGPKASVRVDKAKIQKYSTLQKTLTIPRILSKGVIELYDPVTRTKTEQYRFQYNPSQVSISFSPSYSFKSAPVSSHSYAQYGNSDPITITFDLYLRGANTMILLNGLQRLVGGGGLRSPYMPPPICKLYLGNTFGWLGRVPTGVIDSLEATITKQHTDLSPIEATINLSFKESHTAALKGGS